MGLCCRRMCGDLRKAVRSFFTQTLNLSDSASRLVRDSDKREEREGSLLKFYCRVQGWCSNEKFLNGTNLANFYFAVEKRGIYLNLAVKRDGYTIKRTPESLMSSLVRRDGKHGKGE